MFSVDADDEYFADFPCCCNRAALFIDMKLMNRLVCRPLTEIIRKGGRRVHNLKERIFQFYSGMLQNFDFFLQEIF